jgi:signal transduction histidine kinase/CheY-like chemotaxis protein
MSGAVELPELQALLDTLRAASSSDPARRLPAAPGLLGELHAACNALLDRDQRRARALERVRAALAPIVGGDAGEGDVDALVAELAAELRGLTEVAVAVSRGELTRSAPGSARGELGALARGLDLLIAGLREATRKSGDQEWLSHLARLTRLLQGRRDPVELASLLLRELTPLVGAQLGLFYAVEGGEPDDAAPAVLRLLARWAAPAESAREVVRFGEGLVGQCAQEQRRIVLTDLPDGGPKIRAGFGDLSPRSVVVLPVACEGELKAVIELASLHDFGAVQLAFLDQVGESIGVVLHALAANARTERLLAQSQALAEELRDQQRELTATNRRLELQALALRASEERLRQQQDELQRTLRALEERSERLQQQNAEIERNSREIERAKRDLEERAQQLVLSSKYKSEFLANMSHELRTPLNSLLILAQLLADNPERNLDARQVEFARTIHRSGSELLALINDILDLSKIESGTLGVDIAETSLADLRGELERGFRAVAEARRLEFEIRVDPEAPAVMHTDPRRLLQVLKNLLANAFKFTDKGRVELRIEPAPDRPRGVVAFAVHDTGVGIPAHKQRIIFEAFHQADGTTSRRYGGTGLGLSISREIARLLGGEIEVRSTPGVGSTFTLLVPQTPEAVLGAGTALSRPPQPDEPAAAPAPPLDDDRERIVPGDRIFLIIEDDPTFARLLLDLARERGFRGLVALRGDDGLTLARDLRPDAIALDLHLHLPGLDGWTLLERLKRDARTRQIPVHLLSGTEVDPRAAHQGALAFLAKPVAREALAAALADIAVSVERPVRDLLVVEADPGQRDALVGLLADRDLVVTAVAGADEALALLRSRPCDCAVLDLDLPEAAGFELVRTIRGDERLRELPVIAYTRDAPGPAERAELGRAVGAFVVKSARSMKHLVDETALFLRRVEAELPRRREQSLARKADADPALAGKRVLVIDDDVRNIFAITSVLERQQMRVLYAEDGRRGLQILRDNPDVDVVLLDVAVPEMDGYEAMREIRKDPRFAGLPLIALTARAAPGDREKCLAAGASDHIARPIEPDHLLSLLRAWLHCPGAGE